MASDLRITARFLLPYSHGRGEGGQPEWPPSPLRLFQALVASSLGREPDARRREESAETLRWLERQRAPEIIAASALPCAPYRLFVPDNIGDKVAKRTEKDSRPLRLRGDAVHYVFRHV